MGCLRAAVGRGCYFSHEGSPSHHTGWKRLSHGHPWRLDDLKVPQFQETPIWDSLMILMVRFTIYLDLFGIDVSIYPGHTVDIIGIWSYNPITYIYIYTYAYYDIVGYPNWLGWYNGYRIGIYCGLWGEARIEHPKPSRIERWHDDIWWGCDSFQLGYVQSIGDFMCL